VSPLLCVRSESRAGPPHSLGSCAVRRCDQCRPWRPVVALGNGGGVSVCCARRVAGAVAV